MDECKNYLELMSTMLDGELSESDINDLRAHIRTCPACKATFSAFSAISTEVGHLVPAPTELSAAVMQRIIKPKRILNIRWKGYVAVAACIALVFAAGIRYGLFNAEGFGNFRPTSVLMGEMNTANDSIASCEIQASAALGAPQSDLADSASPKSMTVAVPECATSRAQETITPDSDALMYVNSIVMSASNSETLSLMNCSDNTVSIMLSDETVIEKLLTYLEYGEAAEMPSITPMACIEMADSSRITIWDDGQVITCELGDVVFHPIGAADDIRSFIDDLC